MYNRCITVYYSGNNCCNCNSFKKLWSVRCFSKTQCYVCHVMCMWPALLCTYVCRLCFRRWSVRRNLKQRFNSAWHSRRWRWESALLATSSLLCRGYLATSCSSRWAGQGAWPTCCSNLQYTRYFVLLRVTFYRVINIDYLWVQSWQQWKACLLKCNFILFARLFWMEMVGR